ncbi:MAG: membrane integrity-associated transporter subunit PqiC [Candidatus Competibacteraceae bacterium]|nr:MAG: membrane integrity-associated transporter subunit PqiC [Candidatus Competibacteraceae bacterium]
MNGRLLLAARAALVGGLLVLVGCAGSEPVRYYILSAAPPAPSALGSGAAARDLAVGVGPVKLPEYLDRPQIVTRASQNELNVTDFHRWAESLGDSVPRVLAENLATLLPSQRVVVYPWRRATPIDYQVAIEVSRFERLEDGESVLATHWRVLDGGGKELLNQASTHRETPARPDYAATVAAMNQTLEAFSREVALRIGELSSGYRR